MTFKELPKYCHERPYCDDEPVCKYKSLCSRFVYSKGQTPCMYYKSMSSERKMGNESI